MKFETARQAQGVGLHFEIPVPMPELGHRFVQSLTLGGLNALLFVTQIPHNQPIGGVTIEGEGLRDHGRDRFGVFSRSQVEIRVIGDLHAVIRLGLIGPLVAFQVPGNAESTGGILGLTDAGAESCIRVVNDLIDAYSRVHRTYWLGTVTPEDILQLSVVDWSDPRRPAVLSTGFGAVGSAHVMRFGRGVGYPTTTPDQLRQRLMTPATLAEDLLLSARRDLATRRHRSALAHACLAFEVFIRSLLEANTERVADPRFHSKTMKDLCQRKGCLPALIGKALNNGSHGEHQVAYDRLVALRDHLLHQGKAAYPTESGLVEIIADEAVAEHVELVVRLAAYVNGKVVEGGGVAVRFE